MQFMQLSHYLGSLSGSHSKAVFFTGVHDPGLPTHFRNISDQHFPHILWILFYMSLLQK